MSKHDIVFNHRQLASINDETELSPASVDRLTKFVRLASRKAFREIGLESSHEQRVIDFTSHVGKIEGDDTSDDMLLAGVLIVTQNDVAVTRYSHNIEVLVDGCWDFVLDNDTLLAGTDKLAERVVTRFREFEDTK